jgi:hypothetical protein
VIQICEISKFEFRRIELQRGRILFLHILGRLLPHVLLNTGRWGDITRVERPMDQVDPKLTDATRPAGSEEGNREPSHKRDGRANSSEIISRTPSATNFIRNRYAALP